MVTKTRDTALEKRGESAVGLLSEARPAFLKKGGTSGRENVTAEDLILPRLEVVQGLSPAIAEGNAGYIPGAKIGDLVNSVTKEIYERPLMVIPVHFEKQFNLWKLRKHGGGFMGSYRTMPEAEQELEQRVPASDRAQYEILDTPVFYALIVKTDDNGNLVDLERISISMPKSKAKRARNWNTIIEMTHEDSYNRVYALGSVEEKNKKGEPYRNFTVDQLPGYPNEQMVTAAEAFYKQTVSGKVKINQAGATADDVPGSTEY